MPPFSTGALFFEPQVNPQVSINKMVNKHTVVYHPSPSQLTSRIYPVIFLSTHKGFRIFLDFFFLNMLIPPWLRNSFRAMVLRLLANTIWPFLLTPPSKTLTQVFIITPRQKEITHSSPKVFSKDLFFLKQKVEDRIMELKILPKLKLRATIFTTFTFLVFVLLCHNLGSSMLKCEGSLT